MYGLNNANGHSHKETVKFNFSNNTNGKSKAVKNDKK